MKKNQKTVQQLAHDLLDKKMENCSTDAILMHSHNIRKIIIVKVVDFEAHKEEPALEIFLRIIQRRLLHSRTDKFGTYFYLNVEDALEPMGLYNATLEYLRDVCQVEFTILFDTLCPKK